MSLSNLGLTVQNVTTLLFLGAVLLTVIFAVLVALCVLNAVSFYEMAKKQQIKNKWYGFVPFFKSVIRGNLAKNKNSSALGKISLALAIIVFVLALCTAGAYISSAVEMVFVADAAVQAGLDSISAKAAEAFATANILLYTFAAVTLIKYIFDCFCNFLIYKRHAEKSAVVYTAAGFFLPVLTPIFMFCSRSKKADTDKE